MTDIDRIGKQVKIHYVGYSEQYDKRQSCFTKDSNPPFQLMESLHIPSSTSLDDGMEQSMENCIVTRMGYNKRNLIKTFDCHSNQNMLGLRWKHWLIAFELFADGKGLILNEENVNNRERRQAWLLHFAGTDIQDIFYTLPDAGGGKDL